LPGRFRFGVLDRADDPIVFQFAEEFFRSHAPTNSSRRRLHQNFRRRLAIR
jgi:hypothetical protein